VLNLLGAALSLPARVLDVVDRDRVAGRRASLRADRAMIEVRGLQRPDGSQYAQRLVQALQELPGVAWAGVNAPLRRAIIALDPSAAPTLAELVAVVEGIERDHLEKAGLADTGTAVEAGAVAAPPTDRGRVDQALWALTANAAGLVLSSAGAAVRLTPMPVELAALITAVDAQPRVRQLLEAVVGRPATDVGLAMLSAAGQGLAGGWFGLAVDAAQRVSALGEAGATHAAWRAREGELLTDA
jgi:cation-transporting ATPase I